MKFARHFICRRGAPATMNPRRPPPIAQRVGAPVDTDVRQTQAKRLIFLSDFKRPYLQADLEGLLADAQKAPASRSQRSALVREQREK